MNYIKEKTLELVNTAELTKFIALAGAAIVLPFFIHLQWLTGPIVNAILIICLFLIGVRAALFLAAIPSLMALVGGLLPAVLAPVVPFIMISNMVFILTIDFIYGRARNEKNGYWAGVIIGALLKFSFLFISVNSISKLLIKQELILKVAQMMSWPQFATATLGGIIAWVFLKRLKRI
jgi:hypothetical protein